jgi:hypothetical protein
MNLNVIKEQRANGCSRLKIHLSKLCNFGAFGIPVSCELCLKLHPVVLLLCSETYRTENCNINEDFLFCY